MPPKLAKLHTVHVMELSRKVGLWVLKKVEVNIIHKIRKRQCLQKFLNDHMHADFYIKANIEALLSVRDILK